MDIKQSIIRILKNHKQGLTITELTEKIGSNRLTVTKYMHELIGERKIHVRRVGNAKLILLGGNNV